MKKLSIIYILVLILALGVRPSLAAQFQLDFYGGDTSYVQGDFETSITISTGDTIYADLWCTDIPSGQLVGTIDTQLLWNSDELEVVSVDNSSLVLPIGVWDGAPFNPLGPGNHWLEVIKFFGGNPGPDLQMHTIEFRCTAAGEDLIKITSNGGEAWFDENSVTIIPYPDELEVTVNQTSGTKTTTTITGSTTTSTTTSTVPTSTTTTIISTTSSISSTTTTVKNNCLFKELYGENSEKVELLRDFRDNVLSKTTEGTVLIRLYYEWSPALVKMMACVLPDRTPFRSDRHADRQ